MSNTYYNSADRFQMPSSSAFENSGSSDTNTVYIPIQADDRSLYSNSSSVLSPPATHNTNYHYAHNNNTQNVGPIPFPLPLPDFDNTINNSYSNSNSNSNSTSYGKSQSSSNYDSFLPSTPRTEHRKLSNEELYGRSFERQVFNYVKSKFKPEHNFSEPKNILALGSSSAALATGFAGVPNSQMSPKISKSRSAQPANSKETQMVVYNQNDNTNDTLNASPKIKRHNTVPAVQSPPNVGSSFQLSDYSKSKRRAHSASATTAEMPNFRITQLHPNPHVMDLNNMSSAKIIYSSNGTKVTNIPTAYDYNLPAAHKSAIDLPLASSSNNLKSALKNSNTATTTNIATNNNNSSNSRDISQGPNDSKKVTFSRSTISRHHRSNSHSRSPGHSHKPLSQNDPDSLPPNPLSTSLQKFDNAPYFSSAMTPTRMQLPAQTPATMYPSSQYSQITPHVFSQQRHVNPYSSDAVNNTGEYFNSVGYYLNRINDIVMSFLNFLNGKSINDAGVEDISFERKLFAWSMTILIITIGYYYLFSILQFWFRKLVPIVLVFLLFAVIFGPVYGTTTTFSVFHDVNIS